MTLLLFGKKNATKGNARVNFDVFEKLSRDDHLLRFIESEKEDFQDAFHRTLFDTEMGEYDVIVDAIFGTG